MWPILWGGLTREVLQSCFLISWAKRSKRNSLGFLKIHLQERTKMVIKQCRLRVHVGDHGVGRHPSWLSANDFFWSQPSKMDGSRRQLISPISQRMPQLMASRTKRFTEKSISRCAMRYHAANHLVCQRCGLQKVLSCKSHHQQPWLFKTSEGRQ